MGRFSTWHGKITCKQMLLCCQALTNLPPSDSEKVTVQVLLVESGESVRAEAVRTETANDPILGQVLRPMEIPEIFAGERN